MNSEAVVACINESCKSWHDNNLSLLAAALLLRHFYVPNTDVPDAPTETNENTLNLHQDNSAPPQLAGIPSTTTQTTIVDTTVNGVLNGVHAPEVIRTIPTPNNTPTITNLITPNSTINFPPANASPIDKPNKNSTINALIHATTNSTMEDLPKTPTTPTLPTKIPNFPTTPVSIPTTPVSVPTTPSTPCTPIVDTLTGNADTIHHPTELIPVQQDQTTTTTTTTEFIPVNATVPTRHVKECGHNIICILQKNNFSLSTSKKVSAASQQVYVNHVYPPIDATKTVLEVIAIVKEFWKLQMAPSPLSFCGLVTYMKNLIAPPQENPVNLYNAVSIYPTLTLCPPSPAIAPPRRKRAKIEPGTNNTPTQPPPPATDTSLLAQQLLTCTDQNKSLQSRLASLESDLKSIHQICLQQECELKNMGHACLPKGPMPPETDLKVVPWPYGEKVVAVNQSLWQACYTPHAPPSYWFREEQHILDVINDKEGDIICGFHVAQDILLMKVDLEWLKKSFDHPSRKADETMQHLELAYNRFDGYCADSGEVGLFPRGFAKIARKMVLHRKLAV